MTRYEILLKKKPPKPKPRTQPDCMGVLKNCTVEIEGTLYLKAIMRERTKDFDRSMNFGFRRSFAGRLIRVFSIIINDATIFIPSPNFPIVVHHKGVSINFRVHSYHSIKNPNGAYHTEIIGEIFDDSLLLL